ncbi:MAG: hypothetical protein A2V98_16980 [Planctomycetes bacterium RBG_16_64_12]|nr:MAG: hypothetical protein A2V98_16980 [Planctomycetes bacterium RBG_16_64_12]
MITLYGSAATSGPTPDVKVYVVSFPDRQGGDEPLTPDPEGRYHRDLSAGRYQVVATAEGYRPATSGLRRVFPQKYTLVNLTLVPEAKPEPPPARLAFNGVVYEKLPDSTERRPLPGASVLIHRGDATIADAARNTTDEDGKVTLEVAGEGDYVVLAQKRGYKPTGTRVTITRDGDNTASIILLKQPTETEPAPTSTVPTEEPQTVTGYVVYRSPASRTGVYGVPGAQLHWRRVDGDASLKRQTVAGNVGRYSLELPEGTYQVEVKPPSGYQGASERVVVRWGMEPKYFFLTRLEQPATERPAGEKVPVQGYVLTRSKTSPTGFMRVPDAQTIWTHTVGPARQTATANRRGELSLMLEAGNYDVLVKAPAGFKEARQQVAVHQDMRPAYLVLDRIAATPTPDATAPGAATLPRPIPGEPTPGEPNAAGPVALNVRVLERVATNATRPVAGAEIVIGQDHRRAASGRSDANGLASFQLRRGACGIWVRHQGYEAAREYVALTSASNNRDVFLTRTSPPTPQVPPTRPSPQRPPARPAPQRPPARPTPEAPATFTLQVVGAELRGRETGRAPQLKPLAGAEIKILQGGDPVATGESDKAGRYSVRVKPGTYQVHVARQDFLPRQETVTVRGGNVSRRIILKGIR